MWQFNEKMETLIAAKLDPNYSLWHSAVSRTELELCVELMPAGLGVCRAEP